MTRRPDPIDAALALASSLLFAFCSAAYYGYTFGRSTNQAFYLPWVLARLDPSLFHFDPAVAAVDAVPTYFWRLFAACAAVTGVERTAWALWMLARAVAGLATYSAARVLGGSRKAAILSTTLAALSWELFVASPLAGDPLLKNFLDQTSFAWPLILCAAALWLSGRRSLSLFALGLIANINILLASIVACWLVLAAILEKSIRARDIAAGLSLFLLAACPILLRLSGRGVGGDIELMLVCSPQTYLCAQWPWEKWLNASVQLTFWTALLAKHPRARNLLPLLGSALILWIATALAGAHRAFHPFLALQFFRLDVAVAWLALAASGAVLLPGLADIRPQKYLATVAVVSSFACPLGGPSLTAWGTGLLMARNRRKTRLFFGLVGVLFGLASLRALPGALLHLPFSAALSLTLWAGLTALANASDSIDVGARLRPLTLVLAALMSLTPLAQVAGLRSARGDDSPPSAAESWARGTPPDSLFVVEPDSVGFRLRSRRAVYAEWSDFNLANWDVQAAQAWRSRMEKLGVNWELFAARHAQSMKRWEASVVRRTGVVTPSANREWESADAGRLAALATQAGAAYLVAPASARFPWRSAFESADAIVYVPRSRR